MVLECIGHKLSSRANFLAQRDERFQLTQLKVKNRKTYENTRYRFYNAKPVDVIRHRYRPTTEKGLDTVDISVCKSYI